MRLGFATFIVCILLQFSPGFAQASQCASRPRNLTEVETDFGSRETYYDIGQGISKGMQKKLSSGDLQSLGELWDETGHVAVDDAITAFVKVFKKEVGAIIFLIIGAIYIVIMPIFGICFCCIRCKGGCGGKGKQPKYANACSTWSLPVYLSVLTASLALLVVGMTFHGLSIKDTNDNIDYVGDTTKDIIVDIKYLLSDGADEIDCRAKATLNAIFNSTIKSIRDLENQTFDGIENKYNLTVLQQIVANNGSMNVLIRRTQTSVDEAINKVDDTQVKTELQQLSKTIGNISTDYINVVADAEKTKTTAETSIRKAKTQVEKAINSSADQTDQSQSSVDHTIDSIRMAVRDVNSKMDSINNMLTNLQDDIDTFSGRSAVYHGAKAIVIAPAAFVAIPAFFVLIFGILRLFQKICKLRFLSKLTAAGGYIAAFGIVFAFLFGWLIMLFASATFFGGFGIETVCKPLFRDDTMEIFQYVEYLKFSIENGIDNGESVTVNFGEILQKCQNNASIFAAVKGESLIDTEAIEKDVNFTKSQQEIELSIDTNDVAFNFTELNFKTINDDMEKLNISITAINEAFLPQSGKQAVQEAKNESTVLLRNLSEFANQLKTVVDAAVRSNNFRNETKESVRKLFSRMTVEFRNKVNQGRADLEQNAYPCRSVYDTWQNVGALGCDRLGRPIQGIWESCGLIAIMYIPLIIVMVIVSGILYQIDKKRKQEKLEADYPAHSHQARPHSQAPPHGHGPAYNQPGHGSAWGYQTNEPHKQPRYQDLSPQNQYFD